MVNRRAGYGQNLDAAQWILYAQPPLHYVDFYQTSERALGVNPLMDQGEQKKA